MYPDPQTYARDGVGRNSTYPNAPWLSSEAVQLAGIYGEFGDPLTKRLPSMEGIYRTAKKEWEEILPILLQPISYGTARFLLEQAGGKCLCVFNSQTVKLVNCTPLVHITGLGEMFSPCIFPTQGVGPYGYEYR